MFRKAKRGRAQHRRMRQAFAGAHAGVEGEAREFTSRDEGGWESLPTRTVRRVPAASQVRAPETRREPAESDKRARKLEREICWPTTSRL